MVFNCHQNRHALSSTLACRQTPCKLITRTPIMLRLVLIKELGFLISHSQINYIYKNNVNFGYSLICNSHLLPCLVGREYANWLWPVTTVNLPRNHQTLYRRTHRLEEISALS